MTEPAECSDGNGWHCFYHGDKCCHCGVQLAKPVLEPEPPMTPEEEEQAPEDCYCGERETKGTVHRMEGPCYIETGAPEDGVCMRPDGCAHPHSIECAHGCRWAANELSREASEMEPPPPRPERRPPYAVVYSVQGHPYQVALPGDATVHAVDGALVIQHHLGPVAGIVQVLPVTSEEQT